MVPPVVVVAGVTVSENGKHPPTDTGEAAELGPLQPLTVKETV